MTKKQQEEFLSKLCESNAEWVAQQFLMLPAKQRHQLIWALRQINKVLYKSWAKDMSLRELIEAVDMISTEKPKY